MSNFTLYLVESAVVVKRRLRTGENCVHIDLTEVLELWLGKLVWKVSLRLTHRKYVALLVVLG